jgi:hypothetical protein
MMDKGKIKRALIGAKKAICDPDTRNGGTLDNIEEALAELAQPQPTGLREAVEKYLKGYCGDCLSIDCKHCSFMCDCNKTGRYLIKQAALAKKEVK